ncbi:MAG: sodium-dependent transporter [Myxococcales bacterium]|nr:sodium-dependent transporter [Myxococcales bacterium]
MTEQRGNWTSSAGFILAATGSAIGLGNLWKFPFITWENNGGAFVLVYLVCIAAVGLPIMMAELLIGRKTQKSAVGALKEAVGPAWGLVGLWGVLCGFTLLSYYTVIAGWSLYFFAKTAGWMVGGFPAGTSLGQVFTEQSANGGLQIALSLGFSVATVSVVYFGVQKGIEKIARLFLPVLFLILALLFTVSFAMDGSREALTFIFRPSFNELDGGSVLEALGHAFFTLSLGMGTMITYGSYIARNQSIVKASGVIVLLDTVIALVATVIMFTVIFTAGMQDQVGDTGTVGMLFISLPQLFFAEGIVPGGSFLAPLFYVLVALAALTSTMSLLEVVTSYIIDEHEIERGKATLACGSVVFLFTILAALSFGGADFASNLSAPGRIGNLLFAGKTSWFGMADHFVSNWMLPTGGLAITVAAGWFMTRESTESELVDETVPGWFSYDTWRFFIRYISPAAVAAIVVAVLFFGVDFS